jgi:hypothetical protein
MKSIDLRTVSTEEWAAWMADYVASVKDGSLRAEMEADLDPEWVAKYGDASWDAFLVVSGFCSQWDPLLTHPEPRPHGEG